MPTLPAYSNLLHQLECEPAAMSAFCALTNTEPSNPGLRIDLRALPAMPGATFDDIVAAYFRCKLAEFEPAPVPAYPARTKRSATVNGWTVEINAETLHGWFECDSSGAGGGLTFVHAQDPETLEDTLELEDYDGVFALPKPVYEQLKAWDILMEDVFNPDYEV